MPLPDIAVIAADMHDSQMQINLAAVSAQTPGQTVPARRAALNRILTALNILDKQQVRMKRAVRDHRQALGAPGGF